MVTGTSRHRRLAVVAAAMVTAMASAASAGATVAVGSKRCAQAVRIAQVAGNSRFTILLSTLGLRIDYSSAGVRGSVIANYKSERLFLTDAVAHSKRAESLASAVHELVDESRMLRTASIAYASPAGPHVPVLSRKTRYALKPSGLTIRIDGITARAYLVSLQGRKERAWAATGLPRPPAKLRPLLSKLGHLFAGGGGFDIDQPALRVELRRGSRWQAVLKTSSASCPAVRSRTFAVSAPRAAADPSAHAARLPAVLGRPDPIAPLGHAPHVFAIYWGHEFASQPTFTHGMDAAMRSLVGGPYMSQTSQYGIGPGTFINSRIVHTDPPASTVGGGALESVGGFAAVAGQVYLQRWESADTPKYWPIASDEPVIAVFIPQSAVNPSTWGGYHALVPLEPVPFMAPFMPFLVIKVPDKDGRLDLDQATEFFTHELVEVAADPIPLDGWVDLTQANPLNGEDPFERDEPGDICEFSPPFVPHVRAFGFAVSTYWSNSARACVPGSPLSVAISSPADGATVTEGHGVTLTGNATDPLVGPLSGSALTWTDDVQGVLGHGTTIFGAALHPGVHHITLTAHGSQMATAHATITLNVVAGPPSVQITAPSDGSSFGSDQTISFSGAAQDPQDGDLSGSSLSWRLLQGPRLITVFGSGTDPSYEITTPGDYTVELVATDAEGARAETSITVHISAPAGNPSVRIDSPTEGANFDEKCPSSTDFVAFSGEATDPTDGTLSGRSLVWYDDYNGNHIEIGTGRNPTYNLFQDCSGLTYHTITLVATDSLGHQSTATVHITTGAVS